MAELFKKDDHTKGLIFDCDGTLVDSMPLHMEAWRNTFGKLDLFYDEEFLFSLKGMKEVEIIGLYNEKFNMDIDPETAVKTKHEYIISHIDNVKPIHPVVDVARTYHGELPMSVVSGSVRKVVHSELQTLGLLDLFDFVLTADDPYKPKPAPDLFLAAASKMGLNPENCVVFEDGDPGLKAASNAGMRSVDVRIYLDGISGTA